MSEPTQSDLEERQKRAADSIMESVRGLEGRGFNREEAILLTMQATLDGIALILQDIRAQLRK